MSDPVQPAQTAEEIAIEQRAVDPRLQQQNDPIEPQAPDPVDTEGDQDLPSDPALDQEPVAVKPKKTAEEVLKGRVGHLTKTLSAKDQALSAKDQELAAARARADAAEALLAAGTSAPAANASGDAPVAPIVPLKPTGTFTQADFEAAVAARAEAAEFNRHADEMYNTGAEKFNDWEDAISTLRVSGFMTKDFLDSAMAVEDGTTVLHYLGNNLDEAERINALPPIRKAAEMAKLSTALTTPKAVPVSSAPAPIKPVNGSPSPSIDLQRLSDEGDMAAYIAARKKQGSRWAQGRN